MQISVQRATIALFSVLLFAHFDYLDMIDRVVDVNQAKRECKASSYHAMPCHFTFRRCGECMHEQIFEEKIGNFLNGKER